ncbi:MAG: hypothetical protein J0H95_07180 [Xanthomonadales bacterium]|nr:hypothetical protein [Xanthomonadales bacterium]
MKRLFFAIVLFVLAGIAQAQTTCTPRYGGGYNCYNYNSGSTTTVMPRYGGGYNTYNYSTGESTTSTPRYGGGYNTYNYQNGSTTTTTPRYGGGYNSYNYQTGESTTATPRYGGGYNIYNYQSGQSTTVTPRYGGGYNTYQYGGSRLGRWKDAFAAAPRRLQGQLANRPIRSAPGVRCPSRSPTRAGLSLGVRPQFLAAADTQALSPVAAFPRGSIARRASDSASGPHRHLRRRCAVRSRAQPPSLSATLRPNCSSKPTPLRGAA